MAPAEGLFNDTTGASNVALGYDAGSALTTGSHDIDVANNGAAGEANTIRIGTQGTQKAAYLAGVSATTLSGSTQQVVINANGQLGTAADASRQHRGQIRRLLAQVRRRGALLKAQNARLDRLQRQQQQVARLAAETTQLKQLLGAHQPLTPAK